MSPHYFAVAVVGMSTWGVPELQASFGRLLWHCVDALTRCCCSSCPPKVSSLTPGSHRMVHGLLEDPCGELFVRRVEAEAAESLRGDGSGELSAEDAGAEEWHRGFQARALGRSQPRKQGALIAHPWT